MIDNTSDIYPSKYISAADLRGRRITLTIREVAFEMLKDRKGKEERKPVLYFKKVTKGWVVNRTNLKILRTLSTNYYDWANKTVVLYLVQTMMGEGIMVDVSGANGNGATKVEVSPFEKEPDESEPPDGWEDEPDSNVPDHKL